MSASNHRNPAVLRLHFGQQRRPFLRHPPPAALNDNLAIHSKDSFWTVLKESASLSALAPTTTIRAVQTGRLRSWTELFFLDEAIALAAGHRPCFYCRREDAEAFRTAWATGRGGSVPLAHEMDAQLHAERLERGHKRVHGIPGPVGELPDGAVITAAGAAFTLARGHAFRWTEEGYRAAQQFPRADGLLTPPSTLLAMRAGYRPVLHPDLELNLA